MVAPAVQISHFAKDTRKLSSNFSAEIALKVINLLETEPNIVNTTNIMRNI